MSYAKYLEGKRVCFVGPAPTIKELDQKDIIDNYDVVVRVNRALPVPEEIQFCSGTKTNILYNCLDPDPESGGPYDIGLWRKLDWLCCPYPSIEPFIRTINMFQYTNQGRIQNFKIFDLDYYKQIVAEIQTRPNSGVLTILDLLSFDIAELYITGITFFKGGYLPEYRKYTEEQVLTRMAAHGNHRQEPQVRYISNVLANDSRVKMDKFLQEIVNKNIKPQEKINPC